MRNYELCSRVIGDNSAQLKQKINVASTNEIQLETAAQLSPESGIFDRFKHAKGSKHVHAPEILKHYIHKQTSFNNVWTALLKSALNGVCALKAPSSVSLRKYPSSLPFLMKFQISWSASDHKIDAKIEGVDLNSLFDADGIPPSEVPSKLPNDLLPIKDGVLEHKGLKRCLKACSPQEVLKNSNPDVVMIQESKMKSFDVVFIKSLWSSRDIGWERMEFGGSSGASLCASRLISWDNPPDPKTFGVKETRRKLIPRPTHDRLSGDFNITRWAHERYPLGRSTRGMELFNKLIESVYLMEIPMLNGRYTWPREGGTSSKSLSNRFFINKEWDDLFKNSRVSHKARIFSNHLPLFLKAGAIIWGPSPFRFCNSWLMNNDCNQVIADTLCSFNYQVLVGLNVEELVFRSALQAEILSIYRIEGHNFIQKSKLNWLAVVDENTNLYKRIPVEEIFNPIKALGKNKAPGPDGFTAEFLIKHWSSFKDNFKSMMEKHLNTGFTANILRRSEALVDCSFLAL
ncbi:exodeoxyribonuclease-like [Cucumis melo var. makuwa]|uniref:Exodeoxyribonuclease-like n=1 Tax=Cucumis melo var. makuwa TaxID=1194695 RepID=A0A5D3BXH7_CUCMM|nr:exodeoxyribonuclease-like [Cucumis melo var. makuwa]